MVFVKIVQGSWLPFSVWKTSETCKFMNQKVSLRNLLWKNCPLQYQPSTAIDVDAIIESAELVYQISFG